MDDDDDDDDDDDASGSEVSWVIASFSSSSKLLVSAFKPVIFVCRAN